MIKILLIFSLLTFIQLNACKSDENQTNLSGNNSEASKKPKDTAVNSSNEDETKNLDVEKFLTISQLNETKPKTGVFETKGFVVKITKCKACPPDAICKPCMAENLLISEENKDLDKYELTDKELIIFTKDSENFSKDKEYKFKINITNKKTTSAALNDVELIRAESIND